MEVLFIDACPRKDSRTRTLAECVLARIENGNEHVRITCTRYISRLGSSIENVVPCPTSL